MKARLARLREALRLFEVRLALRILNRDGKTELLKACQRLATEIGTELSLRGVMDIMDREGLHHCWFCPERFSLMVVDSTRVCKKHVHLFRKAG